MKRILFGVLVMLAVGFGGLISHYGPQASIASAYAAKAVCSGVFVSKLPAERVFLEEVAPVNAAFDFVGYKIDEEAGRVSASIYGLGKREAVYRDGLGCTLVIGGPPDAIKTAPEPVSFGPLNSKTLRPEKQAVLDAALEAGFTDLINGGVPRARAIVVMHQGEVVAERYAVGIDASTPLKGWSMNKTLTGLLIGQLVDRGWLKLDAVVPIEAWTGEGDPRGAITLRHIMNMTTGLEFSEDYADPDSAVINMLFNARSAADIAIQQDLVHEPGTHFAYSSGTTNILVRIAEDVLEQQGDSLQGFMHRELLVPLGVTSAVLETDPSGEFVGSSYGYLGAHDWARIGQLVLNGGRAPDGRQIVSEGWIDFMLTPNGASGGQYGGQIWLMRMDADSDNPPIPGVPADTVIFNGHDGQLVVVMPSKELVIVRLGETATWTTGAGGGPLMRAAIAAVE